MKIIEIDCEDERYPERLLRIKKIPTKLYALGNIELLKCKYSVGIVGSRKCSEYGRKVAYEFANEISRSGICVVSGMAIGIDGQAHSGAIEEVGKTIAVLGCGFNHIYPKENEWLFHRILENCGCIITEYAPDVEADTKNFPKRNRIISGLSDAVLVVEAEYRSGSSITAKYAREQGKVVYAVPNNIYVGVGLGTNMMIQDGAMLTLKSDEIVRDIKENNMCNEQRNTNVKDETHDNLGCYIEKEGSSKTRKNARRKINFKIEKETKESLGGKESKKIEEIENVIDKAYLPIYKLLSDKPIHINELARNLNMTIQELAPIITMMEIDGFAKQIQTNYFIV